MRVQALFDDAFWLVAPKGDPAIARKAIRLGTEWTERLLLLEEGHCLRDHALQACAATEVASVDGMEATSLLTLVQMVASGMGVALLPAMAIEHGLLDRLPLGTRQLAAPAPQRTIALVTRATSPHLAEFEALATAFRAAAPRAAGLTRQAVPSR